MHRYHPRKYYPAICATFILLQAASVWAQCNASSVVVQSQQTCACNELVINTHACSLGSGTPQQGCNTYAGSVPCGQTTNNPPACNGKSVGAAASCTPSGGCNVVGTADNQQSALKLDSLGESFDFLMLANANQASCASHQLFEEWVIRHAGPS